MTEDALITKQNTPIAKQIEGISRLASLYDVRDAEGVAAFLAGRPQLSSLLELAIDAVKTYFPDARLALDVYPDPEEPEYILLAVRIQTHIRHPESRPLLKAFMSEWWYPRAIDDIDDDVAIGTEPV